MTTLDPAPSRTNPHPLTMMRALRAAWWQWFAMLTIPFVFFLGVLFSLQMQGGATAEPHVAGTWFVANMIYLAVAVPIAYAWRGRLFAAYYRGERVDPHKYIRGMQILWLTLVVGGLLSLMAVWAARSLTPNIIPAIVAFVFFITQWPKGTAMLRPRGEREDPELYEEPH